MAYNFEDLKTDAKNLLDKAASKANEAVDYSKTQLDRAQLRSKIREKYTELGRLCYNMHETDADETGRMKIVINDIRSLERKLNEADKAVNAKKCKTCKFCLTKNDSDSVYCTKCGEKL
ncbi:MAG: hypothetical protein MRZ61_06500 [Oscillospiraceae bacterium]|nr:hypothetical protein [Oscillospiraceae bacterium]